MKLEIDLVPQTTWWANVRKLVSKEDWDSIRKKAYADSNHNCAICGKNDRLHAHELWHYDDKDHVQKLEKIVALCENCHMIKHAGFSMHTADGKQKFDTEKLIQHFCEVNDCTKKDFLEHEKEAFKIWRERSTHKWTQDFGKFKDIIQAEENKRIIEEQNMPKPFTLSKKIIGKVPVESDLINIKEWNYFGDKLFPCNFFKGTEFYQKHDKLAPLCAKCYKAHIFWKTPCEEEDLIPFFKMLNSFDFKYRGKFNRGVVVFYFRGKEVMLEFLELLKQRVEEYEVNGEVEWRRACKDFQRMKPELWMNAKTFIPDEKK